jgi:spore germination cell wall hydrolase CwlJ-like protein
VADIYGNIPDVDSRGIPGQLGKFKQWNPDPLGGEAANLGKINPQLAAVIAQARADNPNLKFVLGSGIRTAQQQDLAHNWGWSPIGAKGGGDAAIHMQGNAADLWPLDDQGQVNFDPGQQKAVSDAMKAAAAKLNVNLTAGGDWKHPDQPHFEMTGNPTWNQPTASSSSTAPAAPATGTTINSTTPTPQASGAAPLSSSDRDWFIRTVAGEADRNPAGQTAVANVLRNRLNDGRWGNTGEQVVKAPGQFSMWNNLTGYAHGAGANNVGANLDPNGSTYKNIGNIVDNVFSGQSPDPTKGALNYYAPGAMKGGQPPSWASQMSNPITIGAQVYGTAGGENNKGTGPGRSPSTPVTPGTSLNSSPVAASAPVAAPAPGAPATPSSGLASRLPGFVPNSPGAQMTAKGLGDLQTALGGGDNSGGGGQSKTPPFLQPPPTGSAQAVGGPMMLGPGGQNTMGERVAQQNLAQQGFMTQPSLAAFNPTQTQSPVAPQMPGLASGMPSLPGTTLNSPSALQMAMYSGSLDPYSRYAGGGSSAY